MAPTCLCIRKKFILALGMLICISRLGAQEVARVQVSAKVLHDEVPLNRTAVYVVELKWAGPLAQIEFDPPESPKLTNLKLAGSASANRVVVENGASTALKSFEYTLQPEELGMGYIEGLRLSYTDKTTGERHTLYTDRLGLKVIDAVRAPGEAPLGLALGLGLAVTVLLGVAVVQWQARQKRKELEQLAQQASKPLEQEFLEQLRTAVDLNSLDTKGGFLELSRLARQYLQRRFDIPVQGISTSEVMSAYRALESEMSRAMNLEEILQTCDVIKFSGESGDPARLARVYALAENFIRAYLPAQSQPVES